MVKIRGGKFHWDRGFQMKHIPQRGRRGTRSERMYVVVDKQGNSVTKLRPYRETYDLWLKLNHGAIRPPKKGERL